MSASQSDHQDDGEPDDLANDIVGVPEYSYTVPPERKFLPWHRPRKQFVRNEQWRHFIDQMASEIKTPNGTLTYFGLPGVDLLDLRYFGAKICDPRALKLRFLGFNSDAGAQSSEQADLNISLDEISKSSFYDPMSEIVPYDFRQLVNDDSIAWQKTWGLGPYDVLNLDLCDGFGAKASGPMNETYYNAISRLLSIQARRKEPWLLFLTTRVGKDHVHADTLGRLSELYGENLSRCAPFRDASKARFHIGDGNSLKAAEAHSPGLQKVFLVGICKWFLKMSIGQNPPSTMVVKNVLGYRVVKSSEAEDMISMALRFDPRHDPVSDPSKLASLQPATIDECDLATTALKRVAGLIDVDEYLSSMPSLREEMIAATCSLLEAARYDVSKYRKWLDA